MIAIDRSPLTILSVALSQLIAILGFATVTRAASPMMPPDVILDPNQTYRWFSGAFGEDSVTR